MEDTTEDKVKHDKQIGAYGRYYGISAAEDEESAREEMERDAPSV